ncbi:MAG: hypothetical protein H6707_06280 [Deltaproteobacteria bacterium]|nr:hypothetical protein [Deltaproteobacteria bacterium]
MRAALAFATIITLAAPVIAAPSGAVASDEPHVVTPPTVSKYFRRFEVGPRFKFAYRVFSMGRPTGRNGNFHGLAADYFFARRYLRVAGGAEASSPLDGSTDLFVLGMLSVGAQYPWRVTPFVDANVGFGVRHWRMHNQGLTGFAYTIGVDVGGEYAISEGFWVSLAVGWRRPVVRQPGSGQIDSADLYDDTFTMKFGVGI